MKDSTKQDSGKIVFGKRFNNVKYKSHQWLLGRLLSLTTSTGKKLYQEE